jgi:hypothetical protein
MLGLRVLALLLALLAVASPRPARAHAPGIVVSGYGTATADGVLSPGEWDNAGRLPVRLSLPGGGTAEATLSVMNDDRNLYIALQFPTPAGVQREDVLFFFDLFRNHDRFQNPGDDQIFFSPGLLGYNDAFRTTQQCSGGLCTQLDRQAGGTNDGTGTFSDTGGQFTFEIAKPLASQDIAHDMTLAPGETVGFLFSIILKGALTVVPSRSSEVGFGDIVIARPTNALVVPSAAQVRAGETVTLTLRAQNEAGNPDADLYAGVLLPDLTTLLFFTAPGVIGALAPMSDPAAFVPLALVAPGAGVSAFELFRITVPPAGVEPGTYYVFAALVRRGALADGRLDEGDLVVLDTRPVTVLP